MYRAKLLYNALYYTITCREYEKKIATVYQKWFKNCVFCNLSTFLCNFDHFKTQYLPINCWCIALHGILVFL